MIRKFLIILLALCAVVAAQGKPTIAVYPQKGDLNQKTMDALCTTILSALEETERFQGIERSEDFLAAINKEISNQRSNNSDDRDIAKFSDRFKADFVCAVLVTEPFDKEYLVNARIIDVKTSRIELTGKATGGINGMGDIEKMADDIVKDMFKKASRQKLDEIFSKKSGSSGSGSGGQPAATPAEKRSEPSTGTPAEKRGESSTGKPVDNRSGQPAGTSVEKRSEPQVVKDEKFDIDMVLVRGGTFWMGCSGVHNSNCSYDENPIRNITVSNFHIGKYEITQKQWVKIMGANPSKFKGDNLPVENVTWIEVQEFISRLNKMTGKKYRLPTEAEWEYAARGGAKSESYLYSGSNNIYDVAWMSENSGGKTHPVGGHKPNELGLYDMSGNVYEWLNDWYGVYKDTPQTDPKGPDAGQKRVGRGGAWNSSMSACRVSSRAVDSPGNRDPNCGFRLALSAQ